MKTTFLFVSLAAAAALALTGSGCAYETLDEHPCPKGGTSLTYQNFGAQFFTAYCNRCHSAELDQREGAPENYAFTSRDAVVAVKDRIFVRAAGDNSSMPPGPDDPPAEERDKLADWLACGAP
jgi:uncharacterized membrane protein